MTAGLSTKYLGLKLPSPVIVGSCPLTRDPEAVRQFVGSGAGAIVMPSLLQEQVLHRMLRARGPLRATNSSPHQPQHDAYNGGPDEYLRTIETLTHQHSVPILASLRGSSGGEWLEFASKIEAAGANALELNLQPWVKSLDEPSEAIESRLCDIVHTVCQTVTIPVAVKIGQRFTNLSAFSQRLVKAGARGLVLFAHAPQWDVSVERMHWTVQWQLSSVGSFGGILEGLVRAYTANTGGAIAASGGITTGEEALKALIAGADVVMVTSEIYRSGPDAIRRIVDGISRCVEESHLGCLADFCAARPKIGTQPERSLPMQDLANAASAVRNSQATAGAIAMSHPAAVGDSFGHLKQAVE